MTRDSRVEYRRRLHRVVDHIDRHLDGDLSLATLADVAHFSPYHFHRRCAALMGETSGDYVGRRGLQIAATRLASAYSFASRTSSPALAIDRVRKGSPAS